MILRQGNTFEERVFKFLSIVGIQNSNIFNWKAPANSIYNIVNAFISFIVSSVANISNKYF